MKTTNLDRYGSIAPIQNFEVKSKVTQTNLYKYGSEWPGGSKLVNDKTAQTKIDVGITRLISGKTLKEISEDKNVSYATILNLIKRNENVLEYEKSKGTYIEQKIEKFLDSLDITYEREVSFLKGKIRVDFFIPEYSLVIECNGIYWHSELYKDKIYHFDRRVNLNKLGITVLQFNEIEIENNFDIVKEIIISSLSLIKNGFSKEILLKNLNSIRDLTSKDSAVIRGNELELIIDLNYIDISNLEKLGYFAGEITHNFKWLHLNNQIIVSSAQFEGDSGYEEDYIKIWGSGIQVFTRIG